MENTENFEMMCMGLIVNSGEAKSEYVEAIRLARKGDFEEAQKSWDLACGSFQKAHKIHFDMLQSEEGAITNMQKMLLMHAEDQMSSAETIKILSDEIIELMRLLHNSKLI